MFTLQWQNTVSERIEYYRRHSIGSRAGVIKVPSVSLRGNYYIEICKKVSAILPNSKSFPRKLEDGDGGIRK